jgi:hypothetical protein
MACELLLLAGVCIMLQQSQQSNDWESYLTIAA